MQVQGEIRLYQTSVIDSSVFWHGFPERTGGVSEGPRASLNLGHRWGDSPENIETNLRLVAKHAGFAYDDLVVIKHVHGTGVWTLGDPEPEPAEYDGLVSDADGTVLGAFAADCIPLVFADPEARICGVAHAGWRGTVGRIAVNVVKSMVGRGASAKRIRVGVGPCIGACCFEVGKEVVEAFESAFPGAENLIVDGPKKKHVDLRVATRIQLEEAGLVPEHIDDKPPCTRCEAERFFSYRRDGKAGGVHMGYIGLRPAS